MLSTKANLTSYSITTKCIPKVKREDEITLPSPHFLLTQPLSNRAWMDKATKTLTEEKAFSLTKGNSHKSKDESHCS